MAVERLLAFHPASCSAQPASLSHCMRFRLFQEPFPWVIHSHELMHGHREAFGDFGKAVERLMAGHPSSETHT